jgi:hypothetical protein
VEVKGQGSQGLCPLALGWHCYHHDDYHLHHHHHIYAVEPPYLPFKVPGLESLKCMSLYIFFYL